MDNSKYQELLAMIAVLYEKLEQLEQKTQGGLKIRSMQSRINELRKEAQKIEVK